ncbi:MAG TPA: hypothetical protein VGM14_00030 [Streptosporangiaceae bacterium]|jgi:hypothetical protein
MTGESVEPDPVPEASAEVGPADAAGLLKEMRLLRRNARSARHAYWFPLVLFSLLTFAAIPFYVMPTFKGGIYASAGPSMPILGGAPGFAVQNYLGYYWLAALLGGLALTLWWYRRHARRTGLKTPSRGYLITVAALTGVALIIPLLAHFRPFRFLYVAVPGDLVIRGTFPFLIIAIGLCVLAWAERSRALGLIALIYTGTALVASLYDVENVLFRLGWNPSPNQWQLTDLPNVLLPAVVLLAAGVGAFLVQRKQRRVA